MSILIWICIAILGIFFASGIRIIRPTERGLKETMGRYTGFASQGFNWIVPLFQRIIKVNTTECMTHIEPQEIITKDNLNALVDLVVYYKVKSDEKSVCNSVYNVNDVVSQLNTIARTTARNVIGTMVFKDVNSERNTLNAELQKILVKETSDWGVQVLKVELKDITPPKDVQETMNSVIKAQNTKDAAVDFATAKETEADGIKRAAIKSAEGDKQASILRAEGAAKAFTLVNKSFKGNAQKLKQYEVAQESLKNNSKIVLGDSGKGLLKLFDINK